MCGGPIENCISPDRAQSSFEADGRYGPRGGELSYSYGRIISGFVKVGDAGRAGYAIVAVVVVLPVCNCMLPLQREKATLTVYYWQRVGCDGGVDALVCVTTPSTLG